MDNNTENSIISKYKNYAHKNPKIIFTLETYFMISFIYGLNMLTHKQEFVIQLPFENKITLGYGYNLFLPILLPFRILSSFISSVITIPSIFQIKINS